MNWRTRVSERAANVTVKGLLLTVAGLVFALLVAVTVLEFQLVSRNRTLNEMRDAQGITKTAADRARTAAKKTSDDLAWIISQVNSPEAQAASMAARDRLVRIEWKLCGGPCPAVPGASTTTSVPGDR